MKKHQLNEIDLIKFLQTIGDELDVVKNRVRHLIGSKHWGEEGRYKEAILRSVIQRFLPKHFSIGTGFVLANDWINYHISSQIDIIIYDNTTPLLFQEGDFVIVTPSAVKAIIEVKTKISSNKFDGIIKNIIRNAKVIRTYQPLCYEKNNLGLPEEKTEGLFVGLFSYECSNSSVFLEKLKKLYLAEAQINQETSDNKKIAIEGYFINSIALSRDRFLRLKDTTYESYQIKNLAYSHFLIELLKSVNFLSVWKDFPIWSILDRHPDNEATDTIYLLG